MFNYYAKTIRALQENLVLRERGKELRGQKDSTGHIKKPNVKALKKTIQKYQEIVLETDVTTKV